MSGIDFTEEVTQSQLEALAGGELLQAEVRMGDKTNTDTRRPTCDSSSCRALTSTRCGTRRSPPSDWERRWWMPTWAFPCYCSWGSRETASCTEMGPKDISNLSACFSTMLVYLNSSLFNLTGWRLVFPLSNKQAGQNVLVCKGISGGMQ